MKGYSTYSMVLDRMAKIISPFLSKKERRGERLLKHMLKTQFDAVPAWVSTMEFTIVLDELCANENGNTMVFVESEELVKMLWHAKMDIDLEDIDLSMLPHAFTVAWPEMEIDGVKLKGCSVWVGSIGDRDRSTARYTKRYLGQEIPVHYDGERNADSLCMSVCYSEDKPTNQHPAYMRCSIPQDKMSEVLSSEEGLRGLGHYDVPMSYKLNEKETHEQYVMLKLILRMMAYVTACPNFMVGGFPNGAKQRVFSTRSLGNRSGLVLSYPRPEHGSPKAHWRGCHIRSYPKRKDGTKRKGVLFIAGTMVNADVDPVTIKESVA